VISVSFNFLIYCLIIGNTVTLALYRFDQSDTQTKILAYFEDVFVLAFTVEMMFKLCGLGFKNYLRDRFNIFDGIIVIISLVDFSISVSQDGDSENPIIDAFRALRLLRVIKLARQWKEFQYILRKTMQSIFDISNFSLLLFLYIFIMALLGMEIFAYQVAIDLKGDEILGSENV
jgi:hypothetical protein